MKVKVGINGFGRIGRNAFKIAMQKETNFEVVAINGIRDIKTAAHLLKYDSCFGRFEGTVEVKNDDTMIINGKSVKMLNERNLENIPWVDYGVDVVIESTGVYKKKKDLINHINNGVKKVIVTAPAKDEDITIVMGVNEKDYDSNNHNIISNASCTTNCLAPIAKVIDENFGIVKGLMTTVHSYTNDQEILDKTHKDLRRARAAAESIIPTTTGAAKAVSLVLPQLEGKLNGFAMRVPTPTVSVVDLTCELKTNVTKEEVNEAFKKASQETMQGILGYCEEPLVSIDFKQDSRSSIVDAISTIVTGDNLIKVLSWYDNEWGYSARVVDLTEYIINKGI